MNEMTPAQIDVALTKVGLPTHGDNSERMERLYLNHIVSRPSQPEAFKTVSEATEQGDEAQDAKPTQNASQEVSEGDNTPSAPRRGRPPKSIQ